MNKELLVKYFRIKDLGEMYYADTHKHEKYTHCILRMERQPKRTNIEIDDVVMRYCVPVLTARQSTRPPTCFHRLTGEIPPENCIVCLFSNVCY